MFWDIFVTLCNQKGVKPHPAAQEIGFASSAATKWKNGATPSDANLRKIAAYFGVPVQYLKGEESVEYPSPSDDPLPELDNVFPITRKRFPLLGEIACGQPIYAAEDRESYIISGTDIGADFCLRARGDSMTGARILSGDIVFIKAMPVVENGAIAAVIIDDEATLKRVYFYPDKQKLVLSAENPKYEPIVLLGEELNAVRILGRAVAFQSDVL